MKSKVNIFPKGDSNPTIKFSDASRPNIGVCFSGGGTRAMTCAWGQYLGLKTLGLNDAARYISSVSGGTWASSIYNFLPDSITTEELLGDYHPPATLSLEQGTGKFDVNTLGPHVFGIGPQASTLQEILKIVGLFLITHKGEERKWTWASAVAELILEPFGLRNEGSEPWLSTKYFSLSEQYVDGHFPEGAPSKDDLIYLRKGRPFLIMSNNIMKPVTSPSEKYNIVMIPNQSTAVSTGANGVTPEGFSRNGQIQSYGNNAQVEQSSATSSPVDIDIEQPYSLIDAVSTSSAFFADLVASHLQPAMQDEEERMKLVEAIHDAMTEEHKKSFLGRIKAGIEDLKNSIEKELINIIQNLNLDEIVPRYNVWSLGDATENVDTQYTDGGSLENTGILGLLAQTEEGGNEPPIKILSFDNTSTPIEKKGDKIVSASILAPLFGIDFDEKTGKYAPYSASQQDPTSAEFNALSLIQIFDNSPCSDGTTPFGQLVQGTYDTNSQKGTSENSAPAWCQIKLTTVANSLAAVSAGREVELLYVQNAKMLNWQNAIGDSDLKAEIEKGQEPSASGPTSFKNFPYYDLFFKMGLEAKESNGLSQMWAWAIADDSNELCSSIKAFFAS